MTSLEVMQAVANGTLSPVEAQKLLNQKSLKLKVSQKGAVQVNGLRKFPVTLYANEWHQVLDMKDQILAFIAANQASLTNKGDVTEDAAAA